MSTVIKPRRTGRAERPRTSPREDKLYQRYAALVSSLWGLEAEQAALNEPLRRIGVTGCARRQGVSTVAVNVAICTAEITGQRVLLVDANMDHPALHPAFSLPREPGFAEAVLGRVPVFECIQPSKIPNLSVLPVGALRSARALGDAIGQRELLEAVQREYRHVVVDLAPAIEASPCFPLASRTDGLLFVVQAERVHRSQIQDARRRIEANGARLLGALLNE